MAASLCASGFAATDGSTSSASAIANHRPCALSLPNGTGSSPVSSSKLLDELAEVACSPQSPLMKAVQAVWPDFNLSPLDPKVAQRRTPVPAVVKRTGSPLKPAVKFPSPHKSKGRSGDGRKMAENGGTKKTAVSAATAGIGKDQIARFADMPSAALRCFQSGSTLLAMQSESGGNLEWIPTEILRLHHPEEEVGGTAAAKDIAEMTRLRVIDCHLLAQEEGKQNRVRLTFSVMPTSHQILANCPISHPYLVDKKGWTSLDPDSTLSIYGLFCQQLSIGDLCVPPVPMEDNGIGREENLQESSSCGETSSEEEEEESEDDEDSEESRAARLLSQLSKGHHVYPNSDDTTAHGRNPKLGKRPNKKPRHEDFYDDEDLDADVSEGSGSDDYNYETEARPRMIAVAKKVKRPKKKPSKKTAAEGGEVPSKQEPGSKRPMNAFMLFAKKYRQEVTKQHPGKDNRAISTLLGTYWKELDQQERVGYVAKARALAQEHQKQFPNCWKRKRTHAQASAKT